MEQHSWQERYDQRVIIDGATLSGQATMTVRGVRGVRVFVEDGSAWLTQENDGRDIVVAAGEWFHLDRDGLTIIEGLPTAMVTLTTGKDRSVPEVSLAGSYTIATSTLRGEPLASVERVRIASATYGV
jgi:hypothetical protein